MALRVFRGLLSVPLGGPDSAAASVCGRELNMEVIRSRGEGRADLAVGFGMVLCTICCTGTRMAGLEYVTKGYAWISLCNTFRGALSVNAPMQPVGRLVQGWEYGHSGVVIGAAGP